MNETSIHIDYSFGRTILHGYLVCFFHRHIFFTCASIYSQIKTKPSTYKIQNVDEPIRPHPGCLVLPLVTDEPDVHV